MAWSMTHDGGHTWSTPTATIIPAPYCDITISPANARDVAITADVGGDGTSPWGTLPNYVSRNGGQTWTLITPPAGKVDPAQAGTAQPAWVGTDLYILVLSNVGITASPMPLLAVSHAGAPFVWANDAQVTAQAQGVFWQCVGLGTSLYVLVEDGASSGTLFKTSDGGKTWQSLGMVSGNITAGLDGKTLYNAAQDGVTVSHDGGQSWQNLPPLNNVQAAYPILVAPDGTLYALASITTSESIVKLAPGSSAWVEIAKNTFGALALTWNTAGHPSAVWAPTDGIQISSPQLAFAPHRALNSLPYQPGISTHTP